MNELRYEKIAGELSLTGKQVADTAQMIDEGATVPFIARYRKEATGSLDEVVITSIRDRLLQLEELEARRDAIIKSLTERNLLTEELAAKIAAAETMSVLEDIYLPFRPKRRTRATIAKEKGLEPLALKIFAQADMDCGAEAAGFINEELGVASIDEALAGARDIIAEWVNEDQEARAQMRTLFFDHGVIRSKVARDKEAEGIKYKDYYEWEEAVAAAPSHRVLAMRRGEREEFLTLRMTPPEEEALKILEDLFVKSTNEAAEQVKLAVHDSYKRLLALSMETETRLTTKKRADETAIRVFADNLRQLLLAPPLGQKAVLAVDPGFRTGCKTVCLDRQGKLLHHETIFPLLSERGREEAARTVRTLCGKFGIEAIAVGNGTAGRETEAFLRTLDLPQSIPVIMVNESGASIYSASKAARDEFPDHDITVRGAVSIGRRLMDPLAELVKIEPKSIGVGQYQHDVDQDELQRCLEDIVVSSVNAVGVEVNTASAQLLSYVSGMGPALAENVVKHRDENGPFKNREELKKVRRLGAKAFEQAAGFLRVRGSENILDTSAVHPESYSVVEKMAQDQGCSVMDLIQDEARRQKIVLTNYATEKIGLPTLRDIMAELAKPGRDPREQFENVIFAEGVEKIEDLIVGMTLNGIVTNITAFGAFVDIGVHQDGLVHVSEMADRFIKSPGDVVKVSQKVEVTVLAVDVERKRISLSMKKTPGEKAATDQQADANGLHRLGTDLKSVPKSQSATGKPPQRDDRKGGKDFKSVPKKEPPKPFNNPFAEAFRKR
ncbi:MAG: RNA-binding transcriptional accessory protein [Deltaproteobacteria bacterium]|nr:RNA-binding transcriptional accessory protein [Deltaproteobacteria bacterium]